MSYDLDFWKYKRGVSLDHQHVYELLSDGQYVDGLENLPIPQMLERLKSRLGDDWKQVDEASWDSESRGAFQVFTTPQFFRVDCYGMEGEDMNLFVDLALEFDCPLYDPQTGERFDGDA